MHVEQRPPPYRTTNSSSTTGYGTTSSHHRSLNSNSSDLKTHNPTNRSSDASSIIKETSLETPVLNKTSPASILEDIQMEEVGRRVGPLSLEVGGSNGNILNL